MQLDIYWVALLVLVPTVLLLTGHARIKHILLRLRSGSWPQAYQTDKDAEASRFQRIFLQVYLLVMGSEWLQVKSHPRPVCLLFWFCNN